MGDPRIRLPRGTGDRPFEEQHWTFTIAAVLEGSFAYRTDTGRGLMHPGSFVLGNSGKSFECGHDHSRGDRCIAFQFSTAFFEEIAATAAGSIRYQFHAPLLPAHPKLTPLISEVHAATLRAPLGTAETAVEVAAHVLRAISGHLPNDAVVSAGDERRVCDAIRYIEDHYAEELELDDLAGSRE